MKVSIGIGGAASGGRREIDRQVEYVVEAEKLGVDTVWTAEAWGQDAISPLAFMAAKLVASVTVSISASSASIPAAFARTSTARRPLRLMSE